MALNDKEQSVLTLSATNKDYLSLWNELLDLAAKISDRWNPKSTNEGDPGIVLLKVLTACADKLNYNIDFNSLEAFLPSATQQESVRKICDILGYSIKFYNSATTEVTIGYIGETKLGSSEEATEITIPRFTNIKNADEDVNYVLLEEMKLSKDQKSATKICMEGQLVACESDTNNIISLSQLDDNNRYYLPEYQIAENGIFVYNVINGSLSAEWTKVDNLNTQVPSAKVYKFGYDSRNSTPYIQFPDDISSSIEDGLEISYIKTNGASGNIASGVLSKLEKPGVWASSSSSFITGLTTEDFSITNPSAASNGRNPETTNEAYTNYKKTIGTFDTLITCRDYMNKIYQLVDSVDNTTPLVSNSIVSDIRDDINNAITLCSFNDYGICYTERSLTKDVDRIVTSKDGSTTITISEKKNLINNFDLLLYPFKTVYGLNTKAEYVDSFKYSTTNAEEIKSLLEENQTLCHNIIVKNPETDGETIACIKNYLKLNAKITTNTKVSSAEEVAILFNIRTALYTKFNLRQLDFSESIPFDEILECIEEADTRIKNVSLDEPLLYTRFSLINGREYDIVSTNDEILAALNADEKKEYNNLPTETAKTAYLEAKRTKAKQIYNKLALRNILAGRLELFNYNNEFKPNLSEKSYPESSYEPLYPTSTNRLTKVVSHCNVNINETFPITLNENEVIQFRAPNFKTKVTYPSYVNYHLKLAENRSINGIPATFQTLKTYLNDSKWAEIAGNSDAKVYLAANYSTFASITLFNNAVNLYGALFTKSGNTYTKTTSYSASTTYYYLPVNSNTFAFWYNWVKSQDANYPATGTKAKLHGLYKRFKQDLTHPAAKMWDVDKWYYISVNAFFTSTKPLEDLFVQATYDTTTTEHTQDGLGKDPQINGISANEEYKLKTGDVLYINYTESSTSTTETTTSESNIVNQKYGAGTIIRPNFDLKNSNDVHINGKSWSKTTGFDPTWIEGTDWGMFAFGSNEQVEIRDVVEVNLWDSESGLDVYYVYWNLQSETLGDPFPFDTNGKYTLKDGEYFYYTDINKTDMAYYGSGTEVIRTGSFTLKKQLTDSIVSSAEVLSQGISIIPWVKCNLSATKNITLKEYQYVNLAKDAKLLSLLLAPATGVDTSKLDNTWKLCKVDADNKVTYMIDDEEYSLPIISIDTAAWQARSLLSFNCGPTVTQTLNKSSSVEDSIELYFNDNETSTTENYKLLKPTGTPVVPLSFKTNYTLQTSTDTVDTRITSYADAADTEGTRIDDFKIKLFEDSELEITDSAGNVTPILTNLFSNKWTSLAFSDDEFKKPGAHVTLNADFNSTNFGMIMIYYLTKNTEADKTNNSYLKVSGTNAVIYNNSNSWWTGYKVSDKYYLKSGINVIQLPAKCSISIYPDANNKDIVVFSALDIVKAENNGINLDLINYQQIETTTTADVQLLKDINTIDYDHKFYYNLPVESSLAIDINTLLSGTDAEDLSSPAVWYDYNNMNNKFVISEIDADYLPKGITLTKSSKL